MGLLTAGTTVRLLGAGLAVAVACSVGSTPATAGAVGSTAVRAGTVTCTNVHGTMRFAPALRTAGSAPTTLRVQLRIDPQGCTTSDGRALRGPVSTTVTLGGPGRCSDLLTGGPNVPATWTTRWHSRATAPSVTSTDGVAGVTGSAGQLGWAFPGAGGTATGTGSFPGTDSGASSSLSLFSARTSTQLLAACSRAGGLRSVRIVSGTVEIG